jgi:hypothetical protein
MNDDERASGVEEVIPPPGFSAKRRELIEAGALRPEP